MHHGHERADASIPGDRHDVVNASRRDLLRAALFDSRPAERRVGRFVVRGVLGRGGMGTVLEAFDEVLDRPVAIKLLHPTFARHEAWLLEEARVLARLSDPHVVQVYEAGKDDDRIYIVMELVRGQTLRQWQEEAHPAWRACVEAYVQAGQGLVAAHALGLVHRDFKPSNCIRDAHGRVRVLDFGLARRMEDAGAGDSGVEEIPINGLDDPTQPGSAVGSRAGTPAYMAPELLHDGTADARSDQYAFCVALYEALLGRHPFGDAAARHDAMSRGVLLTGPADPRVPAGVRRVLERGLRPDPTARWPSMDALLRALDPLRRTGRRAWQVALVVGLVGGGGLYAFVSRPSPPCQAPDPRLGELWSAAQRKAVQEGLAASGSPLADATWVRLEPQLSAYLERWSEARAEVCEATHVRGEQSAALMDRRMACLDMGLDAVATLLRTLEHADGDAVQRATTASLRLPDPASCHALDDGGELLDPADRALERRLVELLTAVDLGRLDARESLEALREQAVTEGRHRVAARALYWSGMVAGWRGEIDLADAMLETAVWDALAAGDDETALRAMLGHIEIVGEVRMDPLRSVSRLPWARALLQRVGEPAPLRVRYCVVAGNVLGRHGHWVEARALLDEALAVAPTLSEPHKPYEEALNGAASVAQLSGRSADAKAMFERLLEHDRATYGERHPNVATTLNNLAVAEASSGDLEGARGRLVESLAIEREVMGSQHPAVGDALMNLAGVEREERPAEALAILVEARAIYAATLGPAAAKTLAADFARGQLFERLGRRDEAEEIYREVLRRQSETLGEQHHERVGPLRALAELLAATGRDGEAAELRALAEQIQRSAEAG